jgi:hypothetical protein
MLWPIAMCRGLLGGIGPEITAGHVPRFSEHVVGGKRYSSGTPVGTGRISNPGSSISDSGERSSGRTVRKRHLDKVYDW